MIDNLIYLKGSSTIGPAIAQFDADQRDWGLVYFQPEQPVLEGEINLFQQSQNLRLRNLLRGTYPAGGVLKDLSPEATGTADEVRVHTENERFYAILDGIMKPVYAYDDPASDTPAVGGNRVTLPAYTSGTYDELVYLEVWHEEIMSSEGGSGTDSDGDPASADTTVYQHGMVGNFTLSNDIQVPSVPLPETTRRVQLRGQLKVHQGSDLSGVLAKGASGYGYGLVSGTNFYRAGSGGESDGDALNSVDGYAYAIPLVLINRNASVVAQGDISVATDIIPTGSDVAQDIIDLDARLTSHEDADGDVHGVGASYYVARTPRSDHRVEYSDIANVPSFALDSHLHDDRYVRYDDAHTLTSGEQSQARSNIDAAQASHTHPWSEVTSKPAEATRWPAFSEVTSVPWTTSGGDNGTAETVARGDHIHDDRYYTESEIDTMLAGMPVEGHTHDERYVRYDAAQSLTSGEQTQIRSNIGAAEAGHDHDGRYYTETEADNRFVEVAGDTMTGNLTVGGGVLTVGKDGTTSRLSFPAASGGNDPGRIEHIEDPTDTATMRFVVGDDAVDGDVFSFGARPSGTYQEGAKITATGKGYFSSLFVGGNAVSVDGHTHSEYVPTSRQINAGTGLAGGGDLSSDLSLYVPSGGISEGLLANGSVTAGKIAQNAVVSNPDYSERFYSGLLSQSQTYTVSESGLFLVDAGTLIIEVMADGAWREIGHGGHVYVFSNGSNVRISSSGGDWSVAYYRVSLP